MKTFLFILFSSSCFCYYSQLPIANNMQAANDTLDAKIHSIIDKYKEANIDFLILRTYDSIFSDLSQCRFIYRQDSCSHMYYLGIEENLSSSYVYVGRRVPPSQQNNCFDEIKIIAKDLSSSENYFRAEDSPTINFSEHRYTLYGKINNEYILETFEEEFTEKHHSGMLHYVVCSYMGIYCK